MIHEIYMGIKEWLIPQDYLFYDLFEKQAETILAASKEFEVMVNSGTNPELSYKRIKDFEHQSDAITHDLYDSLNRTFITPLDPTEISRLSTSLDDVIDCIDDSAEKMINYSITSFDRTMKIMAELIRLSCEQMLSMVKIIRHIHSSDEIAHYAIEINRLENVADDVLAKAMNSLFQTDDAVAIIKYKDIYEYMEETTDKCEDVANVLSDIAIRHT